MDGHPGHQAADHYGPSMVSPVVPTDGAALQIQPQSPRSPSVSTCSSDEGEHRRRPETPGLSTTHLTLQTRQLDQDHEQQQQHQQLDAGFQPTSYASGAEPASARGLGVDGVPLVAPRPIALPRRRLFSNIISDPGQNDGPWSPGAASSIGGPLKPHVEVVQPSIVRTSSTKIIVQGLIAALPMVILMSIFLVLVSHYQVAFADGDILVNMESTRLLVPLQIASAIALPTVGLLLKLWSYHIRSKKKPDNQIRDSRQQHSVIIEYLIPKRHENNISISGASVQTWPSGSQRGSNRWSGYASFVFSSASTSAAIVLYMCLFLGLSMFALVPMTQALTSMGEHGYLTPQPVSGDWLGRALPSKCNQSHFLSLPVGMVDYSCALEVGQAQFKLTNGNEVMKVVNNASTVHQVQWDEPNKIAFLAPGAHPGHTDFSADTLGLQTTCISAAKRCNLKFQNGATASQSCPEVQRSSLSVGRAYWYSMGFVTNSPNPFKLFVWTIQDAPSDALTTDPDVIKLADTVTTLLECQVTVYNYTYTVVDSVPDPRQANSSKASQIAAYVISDPMLQGFTDREVYQEVELAAANASSVAGMAESVARAVSEIALAYASGPFVAVKHRAQWSRKDVKVAEVPVALVVLVTIIGYVMAMAGLILMGLALWDLSRAKEEVRRADELKLQPLSPEGRSVSYR